MSAHRISRSRTPGVVAGLAAAALLAAVPARAERDGFMIDSPRITGMGGAGVAVQGMDNAMFLNPALLATRTHTEFRVLDFRATVNQNTFHQYGFYQDHNDQFNNLDAMSDAEKNRFYQDLLTVARDQTILGFGGAAPLVYIKPRVAIGVFERARVDYDLKEGASAVPLVQARGTAEGAIVVGYGRPLMSIFDHQLSIGANAKYLYRALSEESYSAPAVDNIDNIRVYRGWTMAFDLGLLFSTPTWAVGAGVYDFNFPDIHYNTSDDPPPGFNEPSGLIQASTRLGASWRPSFAVYGLLEDVQLAFDLENPLSDDMAFLKKVSIGAEALSWGAIRVRAGIHQGYPTAGAQVALSVFKLEYAFGGEALGRHPGQLESWNHVIALGFGWGY